MEYILLVWFTFSKNRIVTKDAENEFKGEL